MLLSVIIPVYNTKALYIEDCLDSVKLLDGLCDYEVIIVNDGSSAEDTLYFLDKLTQINKKNFTLIHQDNGGLPNARNTGIKAAQGTFILPLDSDDVLSQHISYFIDYLNHHPEIEILFGDYQTFGDEENYYHLTANFSLTELLLSENQLTACSFFKKEIWEKVGGYDESYKTFEDYEFWCRCAIHGVQFTHLSHPIFLYRKVNDGQSLLQKSLPLHQEYRQKIVDKLIQPSIDLTELNRLMNNKLQKQIKQKKKKAWAILIYAYCPNLFYWLCKIKVFKFGESFIQ